MSTLQEQLDRKEAWPGPLGAYRNSGYFIMPNWELCPAVVLLAFDASAARDARKRVQSFLENTLR